MQKEQLSEEAKKKLTKQGYRIIGSHSAVKTCAWARNMIRGQEGCYKLAFYGIMSNQCMQMTPSISCANRCVFCWRDYKAPVAKEWKWKTDHPEKIINESIKAHHKLLVGFNNGKTTKQKLYETSKKIKHAALSLTGEPIKYPKINSLIKEFNKKEISTFLVTNAQFPEEIKKLDPVTQLYLSLDASEEISLKKIDNPLFQDYWKRLEKSLRYLSQKKQRTCIRLTMIKDKNMSNHKKYSELIKKGCPDFIEIKAYMWVGASQQRLKFKDMPSSKEILEFAKELLKYLPNYGIVSEHYPSRVVMLAKNRFKKNEKWHTWINFKKYSRLVNNPKTSNSFATEDYLSQTPEMYIYKKKL